MAGAELNATFQTCVLSQEKPVTVFDDATTFEIRRVMKTMMFGVLIACLSVYYQSSIYDFLQTSNRSSCDSLMAPHLTDVMPVEGFHVLCFEKNVDTISVKAYMDGYKLELPVDFTVDTIDTLDLETKLNLIERHEATSQYESEYRHLKQPWAIFTPTGDRLTNPVDWLNHKVVYFFEGGQFVWPGIAIGHRRIVRDLHQLGNVEMVTLSMMPLVLSIEKFLKDDEIDRILQLSLPHLAPSDVTHTDGDEGRPASDWRTSSTYFLPSDDPIVKGIDIRTSELVKVPKTHQEYVQVLRYEHTQKYDAHTDYFGVDHHQNNHELLQEVEYGYNNRMATVFWYMSDVEAGGHTVFPRSGGLPEPEDYKACSTGLKVTPQKGKVIIFYSMLPNGNMDPLSLHGGCPVEKGTKYSGNKWIWNKPNVWVQ